MYLILSFSLPLLSLLPSGAGLSPPDLAPQDLILNFIRLYIISGVCFRVTFLPPKALDLFRTAANDKASVKGSISGIK